MSDHLIPHFQNDAGVGKIEIGVKKFMCCGANSPHDHPHVFLNMGKEAEIVCPYCSTLFKFSDKLKPNETEPKNCFFDSPNI